MADNNKNLYYLHDLPDYKVAEDYADVRGWKVEDADNRIVGTVEGLLVNKEAERVVYLDVEVDESVIEEGHEPYQTPAIEGAHEYVNRDGEDHLIIPVGIVSIDEKENKVHTDAVDHSTFTKARRFSKGDTIDRNYESVVLATYFPDRQIEQQSIHKISDRDFYSRQEFRR